jgi:hypothetical protein
MTLGIVGDIPSAFELSAAQAFDPPPLVAEASPSSKSVISLSWRPCGGRSSAPDVDADVDMDEGDGAISTADIYPNSDTYPGQDGWKMKRPGGAGSLAGQGRKAEWTYHIHLRLFKKSRGGIHMPYTSTYVDLSFTFLSLLAPIGP